MGSWHRNIEHRQAIDVDTDLEEIVRDAKVILSREIRHGILKLTPERRDALAVPQKPESD